MMRTPRAAEEANYTGIREMMKTPKNSEEALELDDDAAAIFASPFVPQSNTPDEEANPESLDADTVDGMKVVELREELKARGLPAKGRKAELQLRLKDAIVACKPVVPEQ